MNQFYDSKSERAGYYFILPAVVFMLLFTAFPLLYNILLSMQDINVMTLNSSVKKFVWFENYKVLFNEPLLWDSLKNTLHYTIFSVLLQFIFGFVLALFFNLKFRLAEYIRGFVMVAWLIPIAITGYTFRFVFSLDAGIVNFLLMKLHIVEKPIGWLIQESTAMWTLILTNTWIGIPFNMLLLTTGLSTVSKEVYESSDIDGANPLQKFYYITVPMIRPAILSVLTLGFIFTFKVFDLVFVMTKGGPAQSTEVLSTYAYRLAFAETNFSKGAVVANILAVVLFIVSLVYIKLIKKDEVM